MCHLQSSSNGEIFIGSTAVSRFALLSRVSENVEIKPPRAILQSTLIYNPGRDE
jgi:hypothetical protein